MPAFTRPADLDDTLPLPLRDLGLGADGEAALREALSRERARREGAEALLTQRNREVLDALERSRDSERRLQLALWASGESIWHWDAEDDRLRTEGFMLDGQPAPWSAVPLPEWLAAVHPEDHDALLMAWRLHVTGQSEDFDTAYRLPSEGGWRWVRVRGRALRRDARGRALHVTGTVKDITEQRLSAQSLHLLAEAFARTSDAMVLTDTAWNVFEANDAFAAWLGVPRDQVPADALRRCVDLHHIDQRLSQGGTWREELPLRGLGEDRVVELAVTDVRLPPPGRSCHIVSLRDITARRAAEESLQTLAMQDLLTGLANRTALDLELAARVAGGGQRPFGLLFMDLDGFKAINDSFGHGAGDALLREIARRLRSALPSGGFAARWGGDEFVVVLPVEQTLDDAEVSVRALSQVLIASLSQPCLVDGGHEVSVSPSLGAVLHPRDGLEAGELLRKADAAMYVAKGHGLGELKMYSGDLDAGVQRRMHVQALMRHDADQRLFHFAIQSKVDAGREVVGGELLMRWTNDALGVVSPAEFIPIAEQTGLIHVLGHRALHAAARVTQVLRQAGRPMRLAVNISPRQVVQPDKFELLLMRTLERSHLAPQDMELEFTETAELKNLRPLLLRLSAAGFRLALDDFGTGYSSLGYLRHLPFDKIKIDRSFVRDVCDQASSRQMLGHLVDMCRDLGLRTVAEGVETAEQFQVLRTMAIDEFQGFHFARPEPVGAWLRAQGFDEVTALDVESHAR
jgi:diguanylate cyclase (GGDEF)-like protein